MLTDFKPRPYQTAIYDVARDNNTLVVLPTGLGKTAIAMMVAARRLLIYPNKKIVFVAPTKPLVEQQLETFRSSFLLHKDDFALFTGTVTPEKRAKLWNTARFIFSTPQTLENDVLSRRISLEDVSLLVVDEAHRATGDYAYVFLAKEYAKVSSAMRILALTASPGTDTEKIKEVANSLFIDRIEFRRQTDPDVKEYTQTTDVVWESVLLPDFLKKIHLHLSRALHTKITKILSLGVLKIQQPFSKSKLLQAQQAVHAEMSKSTPQPEQLQTISLLSECIKVQHALELVETQSVYALHEYCHNVLVTAKTARVRAVKNLAIDPDFLSALALARDLLKNNVEHPKIPLLKERVLSVLKKNPSAKIIIFSQFRDTASRIEQILSPFTSVSLFFGQAKKNGVGFSQKAQKETLDRFREGKFSVLIATSVAEEGLDIPSVDHVFFYEPVPSAIRSVQRRGRTGRHKKGFVSVFVTKNTRDEAHRWVSFHKEKRMYAVLEKLAKTFSHETNTPLSDLDANQQTITSFVDSGETSSMTYRVVADFREKGSPVIKSLANMNDVSLELKHLEVGDFVLSNNACVEFKNYGDFVDSIVDGRLLGQLRSLSQYTKPVLIIEGDPDHSNLRRVDKNAIQGMFATIALSYRIPLIRTSTPFETAQILRTLARREQEENTDVFTYHTAKPLDLTTLLEYVVSSLPGIGGALAKSLLQRYDTIKEILDASVDDLQQIPLIGKKKAEQLHFFLRTSYKQSKKTRSATIIEESMHER